MSTRIKKVPPPYTVTAPDPGGKDHANLAAWIQADQRWKESQPQPDHSTGSGSGINNG